MPCNFDLCVFLGDLPVGIMASLLAAGLTAIYLHFRKKLDDKNRYSRTQGDYDEHMLNNQDGRLIENIPVGSATIKYKAKNYLEIVLTHDDGKRTWEGLIMMETEFAGSITWQYTNLPSGYAEFGMKKLIISKDMNSIYLIDVTGDDHGKHILKRR